MFDLDELLNLPVLLDNVPYEILDTIQVRYINNCRSDGTYPSNKCQKIKMLFVKIASEFKMQGVT